MVSKYLREQLNRHPSMEPGDVMKWCFQASFGAEHLLVNKDAAWKYLLAEYEAAEVQESIEGTHFSGTVRSEEGQGMSDRDEKYEPLFENISDALCRVNLRPWKALGLPPEWLFTMFVKGAEEYACSTKEGERCTVKNDKLDFKAVVAEAEQLISKGVFSFDIDAWQQYVSDYPLNNPVAVHHSEKYRLAEMPAYRLVPRKYMRALPVLEAIDTLQRADEAYIVAIDGRCASGKSTLAALLSEMLEAGVVHTDDFFLPMELRTSERLSEPGGNVHYERILEEVLPGLKSAEAFSYGKFDCSQMKIAGERQVPAGNIRIVEGAYSCHPFLGEYMNLRVFSDVAPKEQLERIAGRDGEGALKSYKERWIPMEERYLEAYQIKNKADIIL